jgi:hypothetical protein
LAHRLGNFEGVTIGVGDHDVSQAPLLNLGRLSDRGAGAQQALVHAVEVVHQDVCVGRAGLVGLSRQVKLCAPLANDRERNRVAVGQRDRESEHVAIESKRALDVRHGNRRRDSTEDSHFDRLSSVQRLTTTMHAR